MIASYSWENDERNKSKKLKNRLMNNEVIDWKLIHQADPKEAKKLEETINSYAKKLKVELAGTSIKEEKKEIIYRFYRKFYTLTLSKSYLNVGINKSPTRDLILDYPWFVLGEDRFFCLKIWETINK